MLGTACVLLLNHASGLWAGAMLRACGQGTLCVLLVWTICRLGSRLPASGRAWLWWLACLKLSLGLLCITPLVLPILPHVPALASPRAVSPALEVRWANSPLTSDIREGEGKTARSSSAPPEEGTRKASSVPISPFLPVCLLWLAGVLVTIGASTRQWLALRRRLGRLLPSDTNQVVVTDAVNGPLIAGLRRPVILLPQTPLSTEERAMALAHERAHLRRGDLWLGLLPILAQTLFFFFPPARWAVREYHLAREEACDAAALQETGATPAQYARLLLRFASHADPAPALSLSSGFFAIRRRLTLLPLASRTLTPRIRCVAALSLALALPGVLPWQLTAAAVRVSQASVLPDPRTLHFVLTDLGTVSGGEVSATGLNDHDQVVGCLDTSPHSVYGQAFLWDRGHTSALPALPGETYCRANGVNNAGQVIASSYGAYDHNRAFIWQDGRKTTLVGLAGFPHSKALGLNNAGQVAGYVQTGDYDAMREIVAHPVLWDVNGRPTDLGTLGGDYGAAYSVNDRGQVVGKADTSSFGSTHAFLWQSGRMTDLGTLGGSNSLAVRVSDTGQIIGYSETGDTTHAFAWQNGVMHDLGTLPGGTESQAHAVNDRGQIVGESDGVATLWQRNRIADLNHLVNNAVGWTLQDAAAINAHGQIAGQGLAPDGRIHAFLLTPC